MPALRAARLTKYVLIPSKVGWSIAAKAAGSCSWKSLLAEHHPACGGSSPRRDVLGVAGLVVAG